MIDELSEIRVTRRNPEIFFRVHFAFQGEVVDGNGPRIDSCKSPGDVIRGTYDSRDAPRSEIFKCLEDPGYAATQAQPDPLPAENGARHVLVTVVDHTRTRKLKEQRDQQQLWLMKVVNPRLQASGQEQHPPRQNQHPLKPPLNASGIVNRHLP